MAKKKKYKKFEEFVTAKPQVKESKLMQAFSKTKEKMEKVQEERKTKLSDAAN
jgi:hypothetical protein